MAVLGVSALQQVDGRAMLLPRSMKADGGQWRSVEVDALQLRPFAEVDAAILEG